MHPWHLLGRNQRDEHLHLHALLPWLLLQHASGHQRQHLPAVCRGNVPNSDGSQCVCAVHAWDVPAAGGLGQRLSELYRGHVVKRNGRGQQRHLRGMPSGHLLVQYCSQRHRHLCHVRAGDVPEHYRRHEPDLLHSMRTWHLVQYRGRQLGRSVRTVRSWPLWQRERQRRHLQRILPDVPRWDISTHQRCVRRCDVHQLQCRLVVGRGRSNKQRDLCGMLKGFLLHNRGCKQLVQVRVMWGGPVPNGNGLGRLDRVHQLHRGHMVNGNLGTEQCHVYRVLGRNLLSRRWGYRQCYMQRVSGGNMVVSSGRTGRQCVHPVRSRIIFQRLCSQQRERVHAMPARAVLRLRCRPLHLLRGRPDTSIATLALRK